MDFNECGNFIQVIKPCPKCGSSTRYYRSSNLGNHKFEYCIICDQCGAEVEKIQYTLTTSCSPNTGCSYIYPSKNKEN